jgi:heme/copper-type cytochrome/quinol oxidase subunit 1
MDNLAAQPANDPCLISRPPRLHWTVVLTLSILTRLLFGEVWLVVQANWIKQVTGRRRALRWSVVNLCLVLLFLVLFGFIPQLMIGYLGMPRRHVRAQTYLHMLSECFEMLFFSGWIGYLLAAAISIATAFIVRAELQTNPIGLNLSGLKTFFFGPVYFQYFLDDLPKLEALPSSEPSAGMPSTSPEPLT